HRAGVGGHEQRPRRAGGGPLPGPLRARLPAAPDPGRFARRLRGRAAPLRRGRLRRLQPQPRPVRRVLDVPAAHRRLLVPAVRGDGGARRARDGARVGLLQPQLPRARRSLPQRRHLGVHAVPRGRPVHAVPDAALRHPARRRGGPVPLGPLPRARDPDGAARPGHAARERLLRHLRVPPARHRPAHERDPDAEHPVRLGDARRGARRRPRDRRRVGRHEALPRPRRPHRRAAARDLRGQRAAGLPPPRRAPAGGGAVAVGRLRLAFACGDYDRTRALYEGTIQPDGIELTYLRLPVEETFFRMMRHREFEVAELSLSSYVKSLDLDPRPFVALPVYPSRMFRHGGIFVNAASGIEKPQDLRGKVVGTPEWQLTAGVWIRGILADHHDVPVESVTYRTGGQEAPGRIEKAPVDLGGRVRVEPIPPDATLSQMLADGEIDALYSPRVPSSFRPGGPVRRLF